MTGETPNLRLCLNLSTLDHADLETQLRASSAAGFRAVGPREKQVAEFLRRGRTFDDARALLDECGLVAVEHNFFSNWICTHAGERPVMLRRFRDFCTTGRELGCSIVVAPTSHEGRNDRLDYETAAENLKDMATVARELDLTIGIEFLPWSPFNTVAKAWELVRRTGRENVGIVLDTFHYFEGPHSRTELEQIPIEAIVLVHIDDVEDADVDILTKCRGHRVLPGEGVYAFEEILTWLDERSYSGYYSLEIMNAGYSKRDPAAIAREAYASMQRLLGSGGSA